MRCCALLRAPQACIAVCAGARLDRERQQAAVRSGILEAIIANLHLGGSGGDTAGGEDQLGQSAGGWPPWYRYRTLRTLVAGNPLVKAAAEQAGAKPEWL